MLIGLLGTVVPVLPGLIVIWGAALVYGVVGGFGTFGPWLVGLMTIIMLVGYGLSLWLQNAGAAHTGASWKGVGLGCALGLVGLFLIPIIGGLIGVVAGVYIVEYARLRDQAEAWRTTRGALLGFGAGYVLEIAVGLMMVGLWVVWVLIERPFV